ncbi:LytR C-terminal domain-containing protein [Rothia nasisuis]|uniref:LytR C-terminal domain-containing protein n=1 Tax=Rothia nasisuis TaxID=2109647 RepID=UPI001F32DD59|nr:LytR C-terminal domain-containing protein [Rothia nasisuis]
MNTYPRDEFDDIDEATARRGAYRGVKKDANTSRAGLIAMVVTGLLALIVGGAMFVMSPRTAAPEAVGSASTGSPSAAATQPTPTTNPASVRVEVYNSSASPGAAAQATAALEAAGYTVTSTSNWEGAYSEESLVYFATGASSEANEVADTLKLPTIVQDYQADTGLVYVVLGADFDSAAFEPAPEEATVTEPTVTEPSSAEPTPAAVERYNYDPTTGTYYVDPAGPYVYDATTGTFVLG